MYTLTLTKDEQRAIDWIGNRYDHGDKLFRLLIGCDWKSANGNEEWGQTEITFQISDCVAWQIADIIEGEDHLACFSEEFQEKLFEFSSKIV